MNVVDFLDRRSVVADLKATHKSDVINELAAAVSAAEGLSEGQVIEVLQARERLGSTGIGDGVAIPHGTLPSLKRLTAAFGRSHQGVGFDAIDGEPAHLFFVLLTPESAVGLQALARVSRLMRDESFRTSLKTAETSEQLFQLLKHSDGVG